MPQGREDTWVAPSEATRVEQLIALAQRGGRLGAEAQNVLDAIGEALTALRADYCRGVQLRGRALRGLCEYRIRDQVRLIYEVNFQRRRAEVLFVGQHYVTTQFDAYLRPTRQRGRVLEYPYRVRGERRDEVVPQLSGALGWDDLYRRIVRERRLNAEDVRDMVQAINATAAQRPCCR